MDDTTHQSDSDALASALGAIGGVPSHHHDDDDETTHHFHHQLQAPDFSSHVVKSPLEHDSNTPSQHNIQQDDTGVEIGDVVDVEGLANLDIPVQGDVGDMDLGQGGEEELDLGMSHMDDMDDLPRTNSYGRPPSIRKACDLCHAAKQVRRLRPRSQLLLTIRNALGTDQRVPDVRPEDGLVCTLLDNAAAQYPRSKS